MKKIICVAVIISLFMILMPLAVLENVEKENKIVETNLFKNVLSANADTFKVYDNKNNKIIEMPAADYIFGVIAAEMPALYSEEALKAQAVASYTYACYKRQENREKDYDITTDFTTDQSFKTEEKAREDWGDKAEEYIKKIKNVVNSVKGEMICYENKPILSVYHAVSSGITYSAEDVWGKKISYLQSVSSESDKLAENYISVKEFTENELKEKLLKFAKENSYNPILNNLKTKYNGLVESIEVFGEKISGGELRTALELSSSNFKFEKQSGKYIFTCYGYGHGVGMSQRGAENMAKQGYNYKQILLHYYSGTVIK